MFMTYLWILKTSNKVEANSGTGMANPSGVTLEIEIAGQEWLTHSGVTLEIEVTYDDAWTIRAEK